MSAGKHTPAPLEVVRGDTYRAAIVHRTAKGKEVVLARVTVPRIGSSTDERQAIADANAALFSAAPDMYEALERLALDRHVHESAPGGACRICGGDIRETVHFNIGESRETDLAHARAALKKARGE